MDKTDRTQKFAHETLNLPTQDETWWVGLIGRWRYRKTLRELQQKASRVIGARDTAGMSNPMSYQDFVLNLEQGTSLRKFLARMAGL